MVSKDEAQTSPRLGDIKAQQNERMEIRPAYETNLLWRFSHLTRELTCCIRHE